MIQCARIWHKIGEIGGCPGVRLPSVVFSEMKNATGLGAVESYVYIMAWTHDPDSLSQLASITKLNRRTVSKACRNLVDQGWMKLISAPGERGCRPVALIPYSAQVVMAKDLEEEYDMAINKGEFLANKRMDWVLKDDEYVTNARPAFLVNTLNNERLEYDRYHFKAKFASEYQGPQHFRVTRNSSEEELRLQQTRDHIKRSISVEHGIILLQITPSDLKPGVLEAKLREVVPHLMRGYVDTEGPYYRTLLRLCSNYAAKAARESAKERTERNREIAKERSAANPGYRTKEDARKSTIGVARAKSKGEDAREIAGEQCATRP
jgi:DNA-binding MarR family transcriptional regulator